MSEKYTKSQVGAALSEHGFSILQEEGGFTIYQTNFYPGEDLIIDWVRGEYEWEDLRQQLEFQGIDPNPIHDYLCGH